MDTFFASAESTSQSVSRAHELVNTSELDSQRQQRMTWTATLEWDGSIEGSHGRMESLLAAIDMA